jgi:hypothetical protein
MAKYLLTFHVRLESRRDRSAVEQSEELVVQCEPHELAKAISAEKHALEERVKAALIRIDPNASSRVSLKQALCI